FHHRFKMKPFTRELYTLNYVVFCILSFFSTNLLAAVWILIIIKKSLYNKKLFRTDHYCLILYLLLIFKEEGLRGQQLRPTVTQMSLQSYGCIILCAKQRLANVISTIRSSSDNPISSI
ncbi:hypothetical protein L9F63_020950, partial [Diploptera punctata]